MRFALFFTLRGIYHHLDVINLGNFEKCLIFQVTSRVAAKIAEY
jgi:hypothetical protein